MTLAYHRTSSTYLQGACTLPREYFTSETLLAEEVDRLFLRRWSWVARAGALAAGGDYLLHDHFGESVIILRDRQGTLRAFANVCRHRGTRLCEATVGTLSSTIQCPYHAWTWTLDGQLVGAPHMGEVAGFDKRDFPLHARPLVEWEGFVVVALTPDVAPFADAWAPVRDRFRRFGLDRLTAVERRRYDVRANWKLILQNYNECLHCPTIHPELNRLLPYTSGANDLFEGEFLGGYMEVAPPHDSVTMTGRTCGLPIADLPLEDRRRAHYYTIFPNMMLSIHSDYVIWYTVWPLGVDRSEITCEWLMHPDAPAAPGFDPQGAIDLWHATNSQDWHICEVAQAGVSQRAYVPGPYSPRESIPAAWDRTYLRLMER
jgi:phenylpropionate dioxygenase-like ring-hydroxylating dioxygenase large terminal subunit